DPLPRGQLAARAVALERPLAAARGDERRALAELRDERFHPGRPVRERVVAEDVAREDRHPVSSSTSSAPVVTWSPTLTSTLRTPPPYGAETTCSIFIASSTTSGWWASTSSRAGTPTLLTFPGTGPG